MLRSDCVAKFHSLLHQIKMGEYKCESVSLALVITASDRPLLWKYGQRAEVPRLEYQCRDFALVLEAV